jgi:hypothetical protein
MQIRTAHKALEFGKRAVKQVEWHAVTEVPPPYQWVNAEPFGDLNGVNEQKTHCTRYPVQYGAVSYLAELSCVIYGHQFR